MKLTGKRSTAAAIALTGMLSIAPALAGGDETRHSDDATDNGGGKGVTATLERGVRVLRPTPEQDRIYYDRPSGYFVPQYDSGSNGRSAGATEVVNNVSGGTGFGGAGGNADATGGNANANLKSSNVNTNTASATNKNDISNNNTNTNTNKNTNKNNNQNDNKNVNNNDNSSKKPGDGKGNGGDHGNGYGNGPMPKVTYLGGNHGPVLHGPASGNGPAHGSPSHSYSKGNATMKHPVMMGNAGKHPIAASRTSSARPLVKTNGTRMATKGRHR